MPHSLRCQNPSCAKIIRPQSSAIPRNVEIGGVTYHSYYCSESCADVMDQRKHRAEARQ